MPDATAARPAARRPARRHAAGLGELRRGAARGLRRRPPRRPRRTGRRPRREVGADRVNAIRAALAETDWAKLPEPALLMHADRCPQTVGRADRPRDRRVARRPAGLRPGRAARRRTSSASRCARPTSTPAGAGWLPNFLRFAVNDGAGRARRGPTATRCRPSSGATTRPSRASACATRSSAMSGTPAAPVEGDTVALDVTCEADDDGRHGIHFNRGVAGSQAYTRKFGDQLAARRPGRRRVDVARARGGAAARSSRAPRARAGRCAARSTSSSTRRCSARCTRRRAPAPRSRWRSPAPARPAGPTTRPAQNIDAIRAFTGKRGVYKGLSTFVKPRSRAEGDRPQQVPRAARAGRARSASGPGPTNVTPGALYGQSNVGHVVWDAELAQVFLDYWELLHADRPAADVVAFTEAHAARSRTRAPARCSPRGRTCRRSTTTPS